MLYAIALIPHILAPVMSPIGSSPINTFSLASVLSNALKIAYLLGLA